MSYGCDSPWRKSSSARTGDSVGLAGRLLTESKRIGNLCELVGYNSVRVQGHSLVFDLPGTGSGECPPFVREYLSRHIKKFREKGYLGERYANWSAEKIISSRSTAVVGVSGTVPAGAPKGSQFDVEVYIPWSTQTTSLQGGVLFPTELQILVPGQSGRLIAGRPSAMAAGPLFINPFPLSSDKTLKADPRRGIVLGGGRTRVNRRIQLALLEPNSSIAQQIQRRVNSRFRLTDGAKVAEAANRSVININVPNRYRDRNHHFVRLLLGMYLQDNAAFQELKLKQLDDQVKAEGADYEAIALEWEAIGRNSLKYIEPIYKEVKEEKAFYAARAALLLEDRKAIDVLIEMARDEGHPSRIKAIGLLGRVSEDVRAQACLVDLLDEESPRLRLSAYQGLRRNRNPRIRSMPLPGNFRLETVNSTGGHMVCVCADKEPRIVIFGKNLHARKNVFFETSDKVITINSRTNDETISITRQLSDVDDYVVVDSSLSVEDLIATMAMPPLDEGKPRPGTTTRPDPGAGLTFGRIAGVIYHLCEEDIIPARFMLLRNMEDL